MTGTSLITAHYATLPTKHYQHRRGEATALVKSFVGLSGAAVAQLFYLMYSAEEKEGNQSMPRHLNMKNDRN